jgi:heme exporter protein D
VAEFFAMGGYGRFIWPAYGIAFLVMAVLFVQTLRAHRARRRELEGLEGQGLEGRRRRRG